MAEYTSVATQVVEANQDVLFLESAIDSSCRSCIQHRQGSGIIMLRGLTNQCRARFKVSFGANIAAITTAGPISLSLSINGEPVASARMVSTPAAVDQYNNVSAELYIEVPRDCCYTVAVRNTTAEGINVANANIIVTREA